MSSQFWQIVKDASLLLHKVIKSSQTTPTRSVELVIQHDIQASINNEATCSTLLILATHHSLDIRGELTCLCNVQS